MLLGLLAIVIAGWRSRRRRLHRHQRVKLGQEMDDVEAPSQQKKRKKEKKEKKGDKQKKEKNDKHKKRNKEKTVESPLKPK